MSRKETTQNPPPDHLARMHRRRMATFGFVILIAGIAIGAALTVILMPRPKPFPPGPDPTWFGRVMADRLEHVLNLSSEQKEQTRLIFRTAFEALREIQDEAKPKMDSVIKTMNEQISAVLTDEQNTKWQRDIEEFKKRFRDHWRRRGRRPGEGGPGQGRRGPGGDPNRQRDPNRPPRDFRWDPNRPRGDRGPFGPGFRSDDPNRPPRDFGRDPNWQRDGFRRGMGPFGPGLRSDDPNRPRGGFGREQMYDRFRRAPGTFGRPPRPGDPNTPPVDANAGPTDDPEKAQE